MHTIFLFQCFQTVRDQSHEYNILLQGVQTVKGQLADLQADGSYSKVCTPIFEHFIQAMEGVTFVAAMKFRFISDDKGLSPGLLCVITWGSHEVLFKSI